MKCQIFLNGLGDLIINMNEYIWIYHYIDEFNEKNNINNFKQSKDKPLYKYNNIIVKSNEIIKYHHIIFYDKTLIIWKPKSLKLLYYNLTMKDDITNNNIISTQESKTKYNNDVKILSLKDIDIELDYPIFIFHSSLKLFLIANFSEENNKYDLFQINIENDKIKLINILFIEFLNDNNKNTQNELNVNKIISHHEEQPTLLVIDDNEDIRNYIRTILSDSYTVLEAANGLDGLQLARKTVPD